MRTIHKCLLAMALLAPSALPAASRDADDEAYERAIARAASMSSDAHARKLVADHGLTITNVTWEDTGRFKGSAVGPNISDMTIQIESESTSGRSKLTCMPVIRQGNFSDRTADISPDEFFMLVGNEHGRDLRRVSLREYLSDLRRYLSDSGSWPGKSRSMLAERDTHVLVSAQAAFLPVPPDGKATFNPVLFNYQSYEGAPAVLAILATREGTSATIIDNKRDAFRAGRTWGQRLFFNRDGERASLTGERVSDFRGKGDGPKAGAAGERGMNMVLLVQVPLKQPERNRRMTFYEGAGAPAGAPMMDTKARRQSDVEEAVIGHGEIEGPFTEIDGIPIERDPRFPIRVTVQFYQATSNGVISEADARRIAKQLDRIYDEADYVGSLVTEGNTSRPTEHAGPKFQPPGWWADFWTRHYGNTGMDEEQTLRFLRRLFGPVWTNVDDDELRRAIEDARREARRGVRNDRKVCGTAERRKTRECREAEELP